MEITVSNYKSIGKAQMKLGRVTVLLGPPAAGKSNLLEAIALAAYFDRFALYGDVEPLARLVRTDDVRGLSTYYDAKTVEVSIDGGGWHRSLRIYFQRDLRLELNGIDVPIARTNRLPHFSYNGIGYEADKVKLLKVLGETVVTRFYGFERFRDDIVRAMVTGAEARAPHLLREDGKNFGDVAKRHLEVFRDVNAELKELSQVEVNLLDDGRVVVSDGYIAERPPDSLLRILYVLVGLSSATDFAKRHGLEERVIVMLEEPEAHPKLLYLLVKYVEKFSEVGHVAITTHSPVLVSLLRDRLEVALYYVYRGCTGLTEAAELDKDKMAEELVASADILFMKPREVLRFKH